MDRPLDIAFHNAPHSDAAEADIRQRVDKLGKRFPHMTGCRVSVEALHKQHQTGQAWDVHVVMSVPGQDLAISREPHKNKLKGGRTDLAASIREAFRAAEKQLDAYKARIGGAGVTQTAGALTGTITTMEPGQDHGYLLNALGTQVYFHRDSVTNGSFASLREGDAVHYVEETSDAGPVRARCG